jgi:hypothetical protein
MQRLERSSRSTSSQEGRSPPGAHRRDVAHPEGQGRRSGGALDKHAAGFRLRSWLDWRRRLAYTQEYAGPNPAGRTATNHGSLAQTQEEHWREAPETTVRFRQGPLRIGVNKRVTSRFDSWSMRGNSPGLLDWLSISRFVWFSIRNFGVRANITLECGSGNVTEVL